MPFRQEQPPATAATTAEVQARSRQVRGLLLIALAVLTASILRTGVHRIFTAGWWHLW